MSKQNDSPELAGIAAYLRQRSRGQRRGRREFFERYVTEIESAIDYIEKLERTLEIERKK